LRSDGSSAAPVDDRRDLVGGFDPDEGLELTVGRGEPAPDWPPPRRRASDRASTSPTWGEKVWLVGQRVRALARRIGEGLVRSGPYPLVERDAGDHARHAGRDLADVPIESAGGGVRAPLRATAAERSRAGRGPTVDRTAIRGVEHHPSDWTDAGPRAC
jgi:hypothetical protein